MTHGYCDFATVQIDFRINIDPIARRVVVVGVVVVVEVVAASLAPTVRRDATTVAWVERVSTLVVAILVAIVVAMNE